MVLRWLAANWLRSAAGAKLRETVTEAAREEVVSAVKKAQAEAAEVSLRPCDVGLVFALRIEAGGLEDLLSASTVTQGDGFVACHGGFAGRHLIVVRSGAGREAAQRVTEALISGHEPKWVISAGFAGGLHPELKRHDILMADGLVDLDGNRLSVDLKVDPAVLAQTRGVHLGTLLTADRIIRLPGEKRALGDKHHAMAVDMETFAVAQVCRRHKIRFMAVRVITDGVDDELPPDVEHLMKQQTSIRKVGAVVGTIMNRPGSVKDMYNLKENALVASDRLAKFLASMMTQLPAPEGGKLEGG
jgi:adenosylhomocysteine nucleosidase